VSHLFETRAICSGAHPLGYQRGRALTSHGHKLRQHRGNVHFVQPVYGVQTTPRFAAAGPGKTYLQQAIRVEGLVGQRSVEVRVLSGALWKAPHSGAFFMAADASGDCPRVHALVPRGNNVPHVRPSGNSHGRTTTGRAARQTSIRARRAKGFAGELSSGPATSASGDRRVSIRSRER